jgi:MoCo/4Fe-4S cofactor protein with predicted Tat translocation signal
MSMSKKYWRGLPELNESPEFLKQHQNEFAEALPIDELLSEEEKKSEGTSRRDFLKVMGFSTAAVALAACEAPVNKAIPYVVKPEEVTPGVANFYASTFYDGHDYLSVLVKTREGRPIKIEGNEMSGVTHGATTARSQASILSLYDGARLTGPLMKGAPTTWKNADDAVAKAISSGDIRILTSSIISPSTKAVVAEFSAKYPNTKHVTYDAVSYSALISANKNVFGKAVVSSYDFSKAKTIVAVACDFLGTWLLPVEFAKQYSKGRKVSKENPVMSKHYNFESNMSLTGANADERYMVKPSEYGKVIAALYNEVASGTGNAAVSATTAIASNPMADKAIKKAAKDLLENKGHSLVICGANDEGVQTLVNGINKMLDNYGKTVDHVNNYNLKQGNDKDFIELVADMAAGKVGTLMTYNCNPVYTSPASLNFTAAYKKVANKVSFAVALDETAQMADVVCPDNHYLESWGDANPKAGHYSLQQPTINPIFSQPRYEGTRQFQDSLLKWAGVKSDYYTYLQAYWQNRIFPQQGKFLDFPSFWAHTLHDGTLKVSVYKETPAMVMPKDSAGKPIMAGIAAAINAMSDSTKAEVKEEEKVAKKDEPVMTETLPTPDYNKAAAMATSAKGGKFELFVYEKVGMGIGNQSNNPWLMELPDPITKTTWDNYITMAPADVKEMGLNEMLRQDIEGSIADLSVNGISMKVPVLPQPGQAPGTIGLALGYGRMAETLKVANGVGVNAFQFLNIANESIQAMAGANVTKTEEIHTFAATQIHHTIMAREEAILREVSLPELKSKSKEEFNPSVTMITAEGPTDVNKVDLWNQHERLNHKWAMTIDMSTCIGCAACVVACTSENNVAVVGKTEVSRTRDMFWLRIDRYYSSDMNKEKAAETDLGTKQMYLDMETPSHNPKVTFQPMLCQHCNHAPCETVCPVLATSHSTEGLNMMTYNRCIGTRYCANNCPYKVRRFNWFNYNANAWFADVNPAHQELGRMVLNPDVVVRSRGVMEKCSMCQQRLQAGKLAAKNAGSPLVDGSVKTACQQACPTNAIMFGDINDENSEVSKWRNSERNYFLLEEIGVKPTVSYLMKVRNQDEPMLPKESNEKLKPEHKAEGHAEEKHS